MHETLRATQAHPAKAVKPLIGNALLLKVRKAS